MNENRYPHVMAYFFGSCKRCGSEFTQPVFKGSGRRKLYCSEACNKLACNEREKVEADQKRPTHKFCKGCSGRFAITVARATKRLYCNPLCKKRSEEHKRRAGVSYRGWPSAAQLAERDGPACRMCGIHCRLPYSCDDPTSGTVDHITPASKGGEWSWENAQLLCVSCNSSKCDRILTGAA